MKLLALAFAGIVLSLPVAAQQGYDERTRRPSEKPADPAMTLPADHAERNALLTGKVKAALAGDVGLRTLKIDVDSERSVVTLKGAVDSEETKRRAEQVASTVEGVTAVKNELRVRKE